MQYKYIIALACDRALPYVLYNTSGERTLSERWTNNAEHTQSEQCGKVERNLVNVMWTVNVRWTIYTESLVCFLILHS